MQWFDEKRSVIEFAILLIAFAISFYLVFTFSPRKGDVIKIDCTWSEISPDFTTEMKQACRQARMSKNLSK